MTTLDTKTIKIYSDLYINLKRISANIKGNANKDNSLSYASTRDYDNSKKFFDAVYDALLNITTYSDISAVYPLASLLTVSDNSGNTTTSMSEEIFKNTLENCFSLNIEQSFYTSSGPSGSVGNTLLGALNSGTKKQHLLYYNKISSNAQAFDEKRVRQIYYTIFLLDVYINIVEAFLSINLNEDKDRNRNMWDNTIVNIADEATYTANHLENTNLFTYANLNNSQIPSAKIIKNYKDIHIVCNQLYTNAQQGMFINTPIAGSEHKQGKNGLYLYIGDKFNKQSSFNYFKENHTAARDATRPSSDSIKLTSQTTKTTTFSDRYGTLHDGMLLSSADAKYTYGILEYSFNNESSGDYTDTKKPYQKLIRMFLIMIRNIKYDNLAITLEYLKFYLHSLKTFLLMSINAINIYHNLAWSLSNCLVLNYPDYKKQNFIKYISDTINLNDGSLSLATAYSNLSTSYYQNSDNFVYYITGKDISATTTQNFKTALDYNISKIENEIDKIRTVIPIKNRYNYAAEPTELIFNTFTYDNTTKKISGTTTMSLTKAKLINDQFNTRKNYLLYIPDYNIKSRISKIEVSSTTAQPEIIIEETPTELTSSGTAAGNIYTHTQKSVYLFAIGISELEDKNINLSNNINNFENNINHNKTKILNNKSIFDANKSKNKILSFLSYFLFGLYNLYLCIYTFFK